MDKSRIFVKNVRKDGKLTVVYLFPLSGARCTKIITSEQLKADLADGYEIYSKTVNLQSLYQAANHD